MKTLVVLLGGMIAALVQSTLLRTLLPPWMIPDLPLLIVLFVSLYFSFSGGLVLCCFTGLLTDLMSGAPEGWHMLFAICVFTLNQGILARIFVKRSRTAFGLFLLDFSLKAPYLLIMNISFRFSTPSYDKLIPMWFGELVASLVVMPFLFDLLSASMGIQRIRLLRTKKNISP